LLQVVSGQPQTLLRVICPALVSENQPFLRVRVEGEKNGNSARKGKEKKKQKGNRKQ